MCDTLRVAPGEVKKGGEVNRCNIIIQSDLTSSTSSEHSSTSPKRPATGHAWLDRFDGAESMLEQVLIGSTGIQ